MSDDVRISKNLSYLLRHRPDAGGLTLDSAGWADVGAIRAALGHALGRPISEEELAAVVESNDKRRFAMRDGRIRANQGHSYRVDLDLTPITPPAVLYHGTTATHWQAIIASGGLARMRRQHVHLSGDAETARRVAARRREQSPLILRVDAAAAHAAGHRFFLSENGVYLTDAVPMAYLSVVGQ
jgi:putative RNA 2'-phosphotransferase